jgi:hypothetical protein
VDSKPRRHWVHRVWSSSLFPSRPTSSSYPVPSGSAPRAHPLLVYALLRVPSHLCPPGPFRNRALPTIGFGPSLRHHRARQLEHETPIASRRSVHRLSQPLDGLLRISACELVSSRSHIQGSSRSGASLSVQPFFPRREELPPCRFVDPRSPAETSCHANQPRLRGFSPHRAAFRWAGVNRFHRSLPSSRFRFLQVFEYRLRLRLPGAIRS